MYINDYSGKMFDFQQNVFFFVGKKQHRDLIREVPDVSSQYLVHGHQRIKGGFMLL